MPNWLRKMEPHKILGLADELQQKGGIGALIKELEEQTALIKNMHAAKVASTVSTAA